MENKDFQIVAIPNFSDVVLSCKSLTEEKYKDYLSKRLTTVFELNRFHEYSKIMFKNVDFNFQYRLYKISSPRIQATLFESSKMFSKLSKNRPRIFVAKYGCWYPAVRYSKKSIKHLNNIVIHLSDFVADCNCSWKQQKRSVWNYVYFHHVKFLKLDGFSTLNVFKLASNKPNLKNLDLQLTDELLDLENFTKLITILDALPNLKRLDLEYCVNPPIGWEKLFMGRFKNLKTLHISLTKTVDDFCSDLKNLQILTNQIPFQLIIWLYNQCFKIPNANIYLDVIDKTKIFEEKSISLIWTHEKAYQFKTLASEN